MASNAVTNAATFSESYLDRQLEGAPLLDGKYAVQELIGAGSAGQVFLCNNLLLNNLRVAVKVLDPAIATDETRLTNFRAELARTFSVTHPHVVRIYDYFEDDDIQAYSMEYVAGSSLATVINAAPNLLDSLDDEQRTAEIVRLGLEICAGLKAIHQAGLKHGRLSTDNVLLAQTTPSRLGTAKLANFGFTADPTEHYTADALGLVRLLELMSETWLKNPPQALNDLITRVISGQHGDGLHAVLKTERALTQLLTGSGFAGSGFAGSGAEESAITWEDAKAHQPPKHQPPKQGVSIFLATLALLAMVFSLFGTDDSQSKSNPPAAVAKKMPTNVSAAVSTPPSSVPPPTVTAVKPSAVTPPAVTPLTAPTAVLENSAVRSSDGSAVGSAEVSAAETDVAPPVRAPLVHTVTYPGETLSIISDWYLGDVLKWQQLAAANPKINPARIEKGQQIIIPSQDIVRRNPLPESHIAQVAANSETKRPRK